MMQVGLKNVLAQREKMQIAFTTGSSDALEAFSPLLSIADASLKHELKLLWISRMAWEEHVFRFYVSLTQIKSTSTLVRTDAFSQSFFIKYISKIVPFSMTPKPFRNSSFIKIPVSTGDTSCVREISAAQFSIHPCTRSAISYWIETHSCEYFIWGSTQAIPSLSGV